MHKNELFFDLVFLVTPLDPPKFTPLPIPPLEVGYWRSLVFSMIKIENNMSNLFCNLIIECESGVALDDLDVFVHRMQVIYLCIIKYN